MILHLLHMRRNVNRNVFNDRENVSATTSSVNQWQYVIYVKSSMCSEKIKHLWYKYYGLFVRMYITKLFVAN